MGTSGKKLPTLAPPVSSRSTPQGFLSGGWLDRASRSLAGEGCPALYRKRASQGSKSASAVAGRQRVEPVHAVQTADVADGALPVACGLLDGVAQVPELVGLAEHAAPVALLLKGLVQSHRSRESG